MEDKTMSDFKKMYKMEIINALFPFRILFSIYLFFASVNLLSHPTDRGGFGVFIFSSSAMVLCMAVQLFFTPTLATSIEILKSMPLINLKIYRFASLLANLSMVVPYIVVQMLSEYFTELDISNRLFLGLINIVLFIHVFRIINSYGYFQTSILSSLSGAIVVLIFFSSFLVYVPEINEHWIIYLPEIFAVVAITTILIVSIKSDPWQTDIKKLKRSKTTEKEIKRLKNDARKIENMSITKLILHVKFSTYSKLGHFLLAFTFAAILYVFKIDAFVSGNNFFLLYIVLFFLFAYENGNGIVSLIGLPITPKQIYLATLKTRAILILVVSSLYIAAEYIFIKTVHINAYAVQFTVLLSFLILFEYVYKPNRFKYEAFFLPFIYLITTFKNFSPANYNAKVFLSIDSVLLIILVAIIVYKILKVNSEKLDYNFKIPQRGDII